MARGTLELVEYRVRLVVYDVIDVVVGLPIGTARRAIIETAVAQALRETPLVAWRVDDETIEIVSIRSE